MFFILFCVFVSVYYVLDNEEEKEETEEEESDSFGERHD